MLSSVLTQIGALFGLGGSIWAVCYLKRKRRWSAIAGIVGSALVILASFFAAREHAIEKREETARATGGDSRPSVTWSLPQDKPGFIALWIKKEGSYPLQALSVEILDAGSWASKIKPYNNFPNGIPENLVEQAWSESKGSHFFPVFANDIEWRDTLLGYFKIQPDDWQAFVIHFHAKNGGGSQSINLIREKHGWQFRNECSYYFTDSKTTYKHTEESERFKDAEKASVATASKTPTAQPITAGDDVTPDGWAVLLRIVRLRYKDGQVKESLLPGPVRVLGFEGDYVDGQWYGSGPVYRFHRDDLATDFAKAVSIAGGSAELRGTYDRIFHNDIPALIDRGFEQTEPEDREPVAVAATPSP